MTASLLVLGLIAGLRHAMDADHLAALTTLAHERRGLRRSALLGVWWGLGHSAALLAAGIVVLLLRIELLPRLGQTLEFCVGLMLIGLGGKTLWKLAEGFKLHLHSHTHGHHVHVHPHLHDETQSHVDHDDHGFQLDKRPLFIGMLHGLAGSSALMLLVVSTIPSKAIGLVFIVAFGMGSTVGMTLMSVVVSLPFGYVGRHFEQTNLLLRLASGTFSIVCGAAMTYQFAPSH